MFSLINLSSICRFSAIILLGIALSACSAQPTELALSNIQLYSLDDTGNMVASSTFAAKTKQITARFDLTSPTYPIVIVERLYYLDATDATDKKQDFLVTEGELAAQYTGTHQMIATRPDKLWPQGNYKIELYQKDNYTAPLGIANFIVF